MTPFASGEASDALGRFAGAEGREPQRKLGGQGCVEREAPLLDRTAPVRPHAERREASDVAREGLRFDKFLVATSCRSCHMPYCLEGCPVDAIHRKGTHLEVAIDKYNGEELLGEVKSIREFEKKLAEAKKNRT